MDSAELISNCGASENFIPTVPLLNFKCVVESQITYHLFPPKYPQPVKKDRPKSLFMAIC